jgi:hypothetical protein
VGCCWWFSTSGVDKYIFTLRLPKQRKSNLAFTILPVSLCVTGTVGSRYEWRRKKVVIKVILESVLQCLSFHQSSSIEHHLTLHIANLLCLVALFPELFWLVKLSFLDEACF